MSCLRPRLARKFARKRSKYNSYHDYYNRQDTYDEEEEDEMNSMGKDFVYKYFTNKMYENDISDIIQVLKSFKLSLPLTILKARGEK